MNKIGKQSIKINNVYLHESGVCVGPKEGEGPLASYFDKIYDDLYAGTNGSWEKAEMQMFKDAIDICLEKNNKKPTDIDLVVCGDLNNQIIIGNYVLRNYAIPFLGVFGACSTSIESIIVGSQFIESGNFNKVLAGTSSHNATAERQFRYPTEYGGQKADTVTTTVTASGIVMLSNEKSMIKVTEATIGRVYDDEMTDSTDMGRAMAIAAFYTMKQHFNDFKTTPMDYDLILTGDLSYYGKDMLIKFFAEYNIDIVKQYNDCGLMIYNRKEQDVLAGGSGCGCCAAVTYGYVLEALKEGRYKKVLVIATGALLNPVIVAQKETIPSIAHAIVLERVE